MSVLLHERLEGEGRRVGVGLVVAPECIGEEMGAGAEFCDVGDLWAKGLDAEVVAVYFAVGCGLEERSFEGRLAVDAEGVDGAGPVLSCDTFDSADPLATVSESTYALYTVWAAEGWNEEVPCRAMRI